MTGLHHLYQFMVYQCYGLFSIINYVKHYSFSPGMKYAECVCCFEPQIIPKGCWIRLKGIHLSCRFQIKLHIYSHFKGCAYKRPCGEAWKGKRAEAENKHQFQASNCQDFSFRHRLHDPEMFENSHLIHKENVKVHSKCKPHASWSCDCPSRPPLFAIRTLPQRTFSALSLRSIWLFRSSDQKTLDPATSHTSASAGHFSDPSVESVHPEGVQTTPLCWSSCVALIQLLHWFALKDAGYNAKDTSQNILSKEFY